MAYKYCEETTRSQPLYYNNLSCVIKLKDVVKREGGENISDISEVIDLDAVAQHKHPNQTPSTMDVVFCIAEPKKLGKQVEYKKTGQKTTVNGRWCLVELKYDVRSLQSLKKDDIEKKINGSKQLIGYDIPFYNKYYFIF